MDDMVKSIGHESVKQVKDCFMGSRSPYGETWAPVVRGGLPNVDTARLKNATLDNTAGGGRAIVIFNPTTYAAQRNFGGTITAKSAPYLAFPVGGRRAKGGKWAKVKSVTQPARKFFPDDRGLPPIWELAFMRIASITMTKHLAK